MKELGTISSLLINRFSPHGAYLALRDGDEVLLPQGYLKGTEKEGEEIEVFIYTDSEDRPVAVTQKPVAIEGEFAVMEVKEMTKFGAFMDWGLPKDLFVPTSEIGKPMEEGGKYLIRVCIDHRTDRLIGVAKYEDFLITDTRGFKQGDEVNALIFDKTDLGYKALIEGKFEGLLYQNEMFKEVEVGDHIKVFIKKVRDDGKLDLILTSPGREKYDEGAQKILDILQDKGFLPIHDKSSPEEIKKELGMSKKHFKQSVGQLYKDRKIKILSDGISLS